MPGEVQAFLGLVAIVAMLFGLAGRFLLTRAQGEKRGPSQLALSTAAGICYACAVVELIAGGALFVWLFALEHGAA